MECNINYTHTVHIYRETELYTDVLFNTKTFRLGVTAGPGENKPRRDNHAYPCGMFPGEPGLGPIHDRDFLHFFTHHLLNIFIILRIVSTLCLPEEQVATAVSIATGMLLRQLGRSRHTSTLAQV